MKAVEDLRRAAVSSRARAAGRDLGYWRYLVRTTVPVPVGLAVTAGALLALRGFRSPLEQTLASVLMASSAAASLDDPAEPIVAASPRPLWWRRATRLAFGVGAVLGGWWVVERLASSWGPVQAPVHLEVAAMTAVVLGAAASTIRRSGRGRAEPVVASAALMVALSQFVLPTSVNLYPVPEHPGRWWGMGVLSLAVLLLCTRDPARRPLRQWRPLRRR